MLIGFKISNLNNQKDAAASFILSVCSHVDDNLAKNIVENFNAFNVYSNIISEALLLAQPFTTIPLYSTVDITCISNVDFPLELAYFDNTGLKSLKLGPTQFSNITYNMFLQFSEPLRKKLIRVLSEGSAILTGDFTNKDFSPQDFNTA